MTSLKAKKKVPTTKADLEFISGQENILIDKEKRYTKQVKNNRQPLVEKQTIVRESKTKGAPNAKAKK